MRAAAEVAHGDAAAGDAALMSNQTSFPPPSSRRSIRTKLAGLTLACLALAALVIAIGASTAAAGTPTPVAAAGGPSYDSVAAPSGCAAATSTRQGRWAPKPTTAPWQWQLQGQANTSFAACVYELDGFETSAATVETLHERGVKVICYLDVGSWENYRPDAGQFPEASLGAVYEGYPQERWLDIAHFRPFAPIMEKRISMCAEKGFDGVEPDNINGWENKTGFPLTRADQLRYNRWIAGQVHKRGMAVALKNDSGQAKELVGNFDFAVVEECFQYHECARFKPFIKAGKAVFETEYELPTVEVLRAGETARLLRNRQECRTLRGTVGTMRTPTVLRVESSSFPPPPG